MKLFGSIKELVTSVFRKDNQQITVEPNQTSTYTADRIVQLPQIDAAEVIVGRASADQGANRLKNKDLEDNSVAFVDESDATKKLKFQVSGITTGTTRTLTVPDATDTIVTLAATQTLTNKTINATNNTISNISDTEIKSGAAINANKIADASVSNTQFQKLGTAGTAGAGQLDTTDGTQTLTNKTISGASNTITNVSLIAGVTGTLPIANGGTNATAKQAAFDNLSPDTTKGDLIAYDGTHNVRFPVGADGTVLTAASGQTTGLNWTTPLTNPMTTAGDLIIGGSAGAATRLGAGTANTLLQSNGAAAETWVQVADANVATAAAIARTKLASGTNNHVIINNGSGVLSSEATLAKTRGGTGADNSSVTFPSSGTIPTEEGSDSWTGVPNFSNGVKLGGGATMTVYDEGTWTPSVSAQTNITNGASATFTNAKWVRLGSMVFVSIESISNISVTSGNTDTALKLTQSGLPSFANATVQFGSAALQTSTKTVVFGVVDDSGGSQVIDLLGTSTGSTGSSSFLGVFFTYRI